MSPVLLDASIYVASLRAGDPAALLSLRWVAPERPVWLSVVVLEELYAGAAPRDRRVVARLERDFDRNGRILVPTLSDWTQAGMLLARLGAEFGYKQIGRGRLTNDALIAVSASRQGITILTANERDFGRLNRFRPFLWAVVTLPSSFS